MNHSPEVLTCLIGLAAPNLNWMPPMTSTSRLSFETAKLPDMTWSRSTMVPVMILDHSEEGNWGASGDVSTEDFVNLRSLAYTRSSSSVFWSSSDNPMLEKFSLTIHGRSDSSIFCLFPLL